MMHLTEEGLVRCGGVRRSRCNLQVINRRQFAVVPLVLLMLRLPHYIPKTFPVAILFNWLPARQAGQSEQIAG